MKDRRRNTEIACSLTTAEMRDRATTLLDRFRSAVRATEELQEGYTFHLARDGETIRLVAELILAERECCPFLSFEVTALPNSGPVTVRVMGPSDAKEFLRGILCKSEGSV